MPNNNHILIRNRKIDIMILLISTNFNIFFIGPSRTVDIDLTVTLGVQNLKNLYIRMVRE